MRKLIIAASTVALLAVPAMASANAGSGSLTPSQTGVTGQIGSSQGNIKNMTTQYKTTYTDSVMGPVSCAGVHKDGANTGAAYGTDTWTCTSTTGLPLTGVIPGQTLDIGWNSDYYNMKSVNPSGTVTAHLTISADGLSETGTASY